MTHKTTLNCEVARVVFIGLYAHTEGTFENQVFTLYVIGTMPRLVQVETWFLG